ncbi:MAG TPA: hypothetical protein VN549_05210 [Negativicutes bacterium]|nr:hypothetical protein [Negativicutes bacterium]
MHDSHFDFLKGIFDNADQHHDLISQKQELINQLHELGIDLDMSNISDADLRGAIHDAVGINTFGHAIDVGSLDLPDTDPTNGIMYEDHLGHNLHGNESIFSITGGTGTHEISFCGYTKEYCMNEIEYYDKEADNAKFWYESYLKDGNEDKAMSWLKQYEDKKDIADSWRDKLKWAEE